MRFYEDDKGRRMCCRDAVLVCLWKCADAHVMKDEHTHNAYARACACGVCLRECLWKSEWCGAHVHTTNKKGTLTVAHAAPNEPLLAL